jgi:hypothetical protein
MNVFAPIASEAEQIVQVRAVEQALDKTALFSSEVIVGSKRAKEGVRGGTMGSPALNEWGYSCRLVDLIPKLL